MPRDHRQEHQLRDGHERASRSKPDALGQRGTHDWPEDLAEGKCSGGDTGDRGSLGRGKASVRPSRELLDLLRA